MLGRYAIAALIALLLLPPAALAAGVIAGVTDIADLDEAIAASWHSDITNAFSNLRAGFNDHLDTFTYRLPRN